MHPAALELFLAVDKFNNNEMSFENLNGVLLRSKHILKRTSILSTFVDCLFALEEATERASGKPFKKYRTSTLKNNDKSITIEAEVYPLKEVYAKHGLDEVLDIPVDYIVTQATITIAQGVKSRKHTFEASVYDSDAETSLLNETFSKETVVALGDATEINALKDLLFFWGTVLLDVYNDIDSAIEHLDFNSNAIERLDDNSVLCGSLVMSFSGNRVEVKESGITSDNLRNFSDVLEAKKQAILAFLKKEHSDIYSKLDSHEGAKFFLPLKVLIDAQPSLKGLFHPDLIEKLEIGVNAQFSFEANDASLSVSSVRLVDSEKELLVI